MKRLILSMTVGALAAGSALAERPVTELKDQRDNADYEYVTVTGSHLKQKVSKRNIITITRKIITITRAPVVTTIAAKTMSQLSLVSFM